MLLLPIKRYPFSSQISFNKKFTRFTFPFKNLPLLQITADIWKETKYESMAIIMGRFHILLKTRKVLYKNSNLMGLKKWWLKSKIFAVGSVRQTKEAGHCSQAVRLQKQSLESLSLTH